MFKSFTDLNNFKEEFLKLKIEIDIDSLIQLDTMFFERYDSVTIISVKDYSENPNNILVLSKKLILLYSTKKFPDAMKREFKEEIKQQYGESTIITLFLLRDLLKNYHNHFERTRNLLDQLDEHPNEDKIEEVGKTLRKLTDRMEELVRLIMTLKERQIKEFDTSLIAFDYDVLTAEARYWLERCRSHVYRIASLRYKSEMQSSRELNTIMKRLTVIMTFLTIVSIVLTVPGTIGAIFGIPALSNKYFEPHIGFLVITLIVATLLSIIFGYLYWKNLKLS